MDDCIFCRIGRGEIPARVVYEDDTVMAFHDASPQAPVHVLVIPKGHTEDLLDARNLPEGQLGHLLHVAAQVADALGLGERGFRILSNCGKDACQSVPHLHIHVLGGRPMSPELG